MNGGRHLVWKVVPTGITLSSIRYHGKQIRATGTRLAETCTAGHELLESLEDGNTASARPRASQSKNHSDSVEANSHDEGKTLGPVPHLFLNSSWKTTFLSRSVHLTTQLFLKLSCPNFTCPTSLSNPRTCRCISLAGISTTLLSTLPSISPSPVLPVSSLSFAPFNNIYMTASCPSFFSHFFSIC